MTKTKKIYEGSLNYEKGVVYDYEEITGDISSRSGTIEAGAFPALTSNGCSEAFKDFFKKKGE